MATNITNTLNTPNYDEPVFFNKKRLPITSIITPQWLSSWEGKTLIEKIEKIFFELIKTSIFITLVIPTFTFGIDVLFNPVTKKIKTESINQEIISDTSKKILGVSIGALFASTVAYFAYQYFSTRNLTSNPNLTKNLPRALWLNDLTSPNNDKVMNLISKIHQRYKLFIENVNSVEKMCEVINNQKEPISRLFIRADNSSFHYITIAGKKLTNSTSFPINCFSKLIKNSIIDLALKDGNLFGLNNALFSFLGIKKY